MNAHCLSGVGVSALLVLAASGADVADTALVGHWPLQSDCRDSSGNGNHGVNSGVVFGGDDGAVFDGVGAHVRVPAAATLALGRGDFSIAVWVRADAGAGVVPGDILSAYDPAARRGVNLALLSSVGATTAQSNYRNLFFGIDGGDATPGWVDCGRPGGSRMIWALTVHDGALFAGTWEPGAGETGRVYRYAGGDAWEDCGSPDASNTVSALAVFQGKLYAGTSFYSGKGSAQPESPNRNPGGKVFRYEGGKNWTDCGRIGDVWTVTGLVPHGGKLYATTCDSYGCPKRTAACFRYDGGTKWTFAGNPGGRMGAFVVHRGVLHATVFGKEGFARHGGGTDWTPLGVIPGVGQTYSAVIYRGEICLGTWPEGKVFRFDGPGKFADLGRLGAEKEVMAMAVYNGKLYAGTLPLGEVYRYDDAAGWTRTGQLDTTPDVLYRRVWAMAVYQGKLFAGTLPAGRVLSLEAGKCVTHDQALAPGWRHVVGVKSGGTLKLYVDGQCVAASTAFDANALDLGSGVPFRIGAGEHNFFQGNMRDLRLYRRALGADEVGQLAPPP